MKWYDDQPETFCLSAYSVDSNHKHKQEHVEKQRKNAYGKCGPNLTENKNASSYQQSQP